MKEKRLNTCREESYTQQVAAKATMIDPLLTEMVQTSG
jgi:hypothetical protein